ncbi:unnamed protein product [Moneuplotes crassus]|uniref:Uncharacterized protein n=1 Tax=Euplotes crassus TaxID=5936 RepID=A0AAD1UBQ4_EUPCR|nr:unnamed protein product [Moneuplotes crassus]
MEKANLYRNKRRNSYFKKARRYSRSYSKEASTTNECSPLIEKLEGFNFENSTIVKCNHCGICSTSDGCCVCQDECNNNPCWMNTEKECSLNKPSNMIFVTKKEELLVIKLCSITECSLNLLSESMRRPQTFIRRQEQDFWFEAFPKMNQLMYYKNKINLGRNHPPMYSTTDYRRYCLSLYGRFDAIWINLCPDFSEKFDIKVPSTGLKSNSESNLGEISEERKIDLHPSLINSHEHWTFEEIKSLPIKEIAETQCFLFMWVGSGEYLEKGRDLLKHWGFRRCEDIVWIKTRKPSNLGSSVQNNDEIIYDNPDRVFKRTKEHCLVGIKGTVRRVSDTHLIHTNIDTDVVIDEEPNCFWSNEKPSELFDIIERFSLGRKKIQIFGSKNTIRKGWLTTIHKDLTKNFSDIHDSTYNKDKYDSFFDTDVDYNTLDDHQGGRYTGTTKEIEELRPKTPATQKCSTNQK